MKYKPPSARQTAVAHAPPSSVSKPNIEDALRRVSVVTYQHIGRCEHKRLQQMQADAIRSKNKQQAPLEDIDEEEEEEDVTELFGEEQYVNPKYMYTFIRAPMVHPMTCYGMQKLKRTFLAPTVEEIYKFCKHLFTKAQLSSECTIVCLVYVERLMEMANVPLLAMNWRPILLCGLLLASKVWQDLSSWNVEFSQIYPQFPLHNINRLERNFLHHIRWDLYISGSVYAKYYFALRSMTEKKDFRRRYNYTVQVHAPNSKRLEERSQALRNDLWSKSL